MGNLRTMKNEQKRNCWSALACSLAAGVALSTPCQAAFTITDVEFWVDHSSVAGAGSLAQSVLVLDWNDDNGPLAWGFQWDAGESITGEDMITMIVNFDGRLNVDLTPSDFGAFFNTAAYAGDDDGNVARTATSDNVDFIYWAYSLYDPSTGQPEPWASGSDASTSLVSAPVGMSTRVLEDGSYDVWRYSATNADFNFTQAIPTEQPVAVVPEPSGVALVLSVVALCLFRRSR